MRRPYGPTTTATTVSSTIRTIIAAAILSASAAAQPAMREADRVRIAEAYHLAEAVQESIWSGWSEVPFVVLLVTPADEFLVGHPYPSEDFAPLGHDSLLGTHVHHRPSSGSYPTSFLATFPAVRGVNTVVIGQPEHTGKSSTYWVITALHEHFHQLQYTRAGYFDRVAALDLAGGDETGMWQINYPFPYESEEVAERFMAYKTALEAALAAAGGDGGGRAPGSVSRRPDPVLREGLSEPDYRYLSFQLWQEGVARYTEYAVAAAAADGYEPTPAFRALDDYVPYAAALDTLRAGLAEEMATLDLASWQRVVFYPVGASEAMLLDEVSPDWRRRYHDEPFFLERFTTPGNGLTPSGAGLADLASAPPHPRPACEALRLAWAASYSSSPPAATNRSRSRRLSPSPTRRRWSRRPTSGVYAGSRAIGAGQARGGPLLRGLPLRQRQHHRRNDVCRLDAGVGRDSSVIVLSGNVLITRGANS